MSNTKQNVYTKSSFRSDIADAEYEEVVVENHSTVYDDALSVQKTDPSKVVHITLPNIPERKAVIHYHQKFQISLPLLFLIIIGSLIAIVLTGVVTFFITKYTLPETQCLSFMMHFVTSEFNLDAEEPACYWSSWSFWSKCSITCGNGIQVRIRQQMNNTRLCSYNETHDNKICSRGACPGDDVLLDMRFSRTELYKKWFISADNTIISNVNTIETSNSADAQLQNYRGTISNICVGNNELIYYEVNFSYTIVKELSKNNLVLEVGLAENSKVDRHHYVGNKNISGWSFHLARQKETDTVNLFFQYDNIYRVYESFSYVTVGTKVDGKFKMFINRRRNEFSLRQDDSVFHVFMNLTSTEKLCPVFAVYNSDRVHVKLQLMNPRNFTYYPW
ncbi:unnamed protein product [Mytilus coruscus]|uniref:THBS2S n=1 Tax=Mytilus coruscus TaxID=42192 RepID=A0A6J8DMB5_MYTCO|nr:unnamed protein product [Mytilus coruscus]